MLAPLLACLCQSPALAATVATDQADYLPGSTVVITGSGFQAGEDVRLQVANLTNPEDTDVEHDPWIVAADTNGNFIATWLVTSDELDATLQLTAIGQASGLTAQAIFTDGNASDGTGNLTVSPTSVNAGTTNTQVFTFSTDTGKDYLAHSLATIVIPAGWTPPQTNSSGALGFVSVVTNGTSTQIPLTASITNVTGTGPWTVYIDFSAQKGGNGFIFTYRNAVAPAATGTNAFTVSTRNSATVGGVLTPLVTGNPSSVVVVGPPTKLGFTTAPQTLTAGVNSSTVTVQIQDFGGNPTNATLARVVSLSSTSGSAVFKSVAGTTISSFTIAVGQNSTNFLYYDTLAGSPSVTASSTSPTAIASATQVETVNPAAASKLVFTTAAVTSTVGVASSSLTVQRQDQFNNPNAADANRTVTLSSSSAGPVSFSPSSLTISNGSSSASFTYTDNRAGTPTITAASTSPTSITSATQLETITKVTPTISGVSVSQTITFGSTVSLSGTVSAPGSIYPADGETVSVSINGVTNFSTVSGGAGGFSLTFASTNIPYAPSAYTITYSYTGDANLNAAANNTSTTLTVNRKPVTITGVTVANKAYDGTNTATVSGGTVSGAVNGNAVTFTNGTGAFASKNVGTWAVTASGYALSTSGVSTNYTLSAQPTVPNASITGPALTIAATDQSKNFGTALNLGTTAFTVGTGLVAGESITAVVLTANGGTNATDPAGSYTITPSAAIGNGGFLAGNYNITYATGTLTVVMVTNVWAANGNLLVKVSDATGSAGSGYTQTNYNGFLDIQATSLNPYTIQLASLAGALPGLAANWNYASNYSWSIATTTHGVLNFDPSHIAVDTTAFTNDLAGGIFTVTLSGDGKSVNLVFTPNRPPTAAPVTYGRAWGTSVRISIPNLIANYTTDPDGNARALLRLGTSTNGASVATNATMILFAPASNISESFAYVVRDVLTSYRPRDTVQTATNWITVSVTNAVSSAQSISSSGSGLVVRFAGVPGYAYDVERSSDLSNWSVVQTTNAPAAGIWEFFDSNPPVPSAFYRSRQH